ncbi:MAG: 2-C-methyl-D-erythritol 4-phosphate cytidylyltransferase [Corynebacterium sp.]|nr:2-C-methyl-D-erythritol 4-phosphate cytidylyltransferase [Corynebacterium sp.]
MTTTNTITALVAAAGQGTRLGEGIPKALVKVGGKTLLEHCVSGLRDAQVHNIVVVVSPDMVDEVRKILGDSVRIVLGGQERMDSVMAGLATIDDGIVLIHDAARAFTPPDMIHRVIDATIEHKAVIPVLPVTDTIKRVAGGTVVDTPDRSSLRAVQTPQGFELAHLKAAYAARPACLATDDASLMEWYGTPVHCVDGDPKALKITTPLDLILARALLEGAQ